MEGGAFNWGDKKIIQGEREETKINNTESIWRTMET